MRCVRQGPCAEATDWDCADCLLLRQLASVISTDASNCSRSDVNRLTSPDAPTSAILLHLLPVRAQCDYNAIDGYGES